MSGRPPPIEPRRAADFERELRERARAWIPGWAFADHEGDFGAALLGIAGRFASEVAERLDRVGDKMARGFLDWLALGGRAAQPARVPVVLKLADTAGAVDAKAPVQLQADANGTSVVFETLKDVHLVPGGIEHVVGANAAGDAFMLPPPGLSSLAPLEPLPTRWTLKSFAAPGAATLQLDPEQGLAPDLLIEIAAQQFRVVAIKGDLATIDPPVPITGGFEAGTVASKVAAFAPFDVTARNWQAHVVYIGDNDLFDLEADTLLDVVGGQYLDSNATWEYWGKNALAADAEHIDWWPLEPDATGASIADARPLRKRAGSMEKRKVGDVQSRWIRARTGPLAGTCDAITLDALALRINDVAARSDVQSSVAAEPNAPPPIVPTVFVNSTPTPPEQFYPLGRTPRMFDTLYLGCAEAFAKPKANVQLEFRLADLAFDALALVAAGPTGATLAGIGGAGALHLFQINLDGTLAPLFERGGLQPKRSVGPPASAQIPVALAKGNFRPAAWASGADFYVAAATPNEVFVWHEKNGRKNESDWISLGEPPPGAGTSNDIAGLALLDAGGVATVVALRGGRLTMRTLQATQWTSLALSNALDFAAIASIRSAAAPTGVADAIVGITTDKKLYRVKPNQATEVLDDVAPDVGPYAALDGATLSVVARRSATATLVALQAPFAAASFSPPPPGAGPFEVDLEGERIASTLLDAHGNGVNLTMYAVSRNATGGAQSVLAWLPFDANLAKVLFRTPADPSFGALAGAPTLHGTRVYVPGARAEVLAASFPGPRIALTADAGSFVAALATATTFTFVAGDTVALLDPANPLLAVVAASPTSVGADRYYWLDTLLDVDASSPRDCALFATSGAAFAGTKSAPLELALDGGDTTTRVGAWLLVDGTPRKVFRVQSIAAGVATLAPLVAGDVLSAGPGIPYWNGVLVEGHVVPALTLDATNNTQWEVRVLERGDLYFPALEPLRQRVTAIMTDPAHPERALRVALAERWTVLPPAAPANVAFVVDATSVTWASLIGDTTSNPALSWEYWNGAGWVRLLVDDANDETQNLKHSGSVKFVAPPDLKPSDWSGTTDHWIRARLVGGDYGQERVTVKATTSGNTTTQEIERSIAGIQAPFALDVAVTYSLATKATPAYLVTEDSGTRRDQSDANRTQAARIELFTPLCGALARLAQPAASAPQATCTPQTVCVRDCDCGAADTSRSVAVGAASSPPDAAASAASAATDAARAIYVGLTAPPSGEPVNLLFVVERENAYDDFAPLRVEALVGGRFVPIVAADGTRALGESGIVSMSFPVAPGAATLFGRSLTWLRFAPGNGTAGPSWQPSLRGVYLNAAWAEAAETMTRELLGSSDGEPNLVLRLARPPLLQGTLELRVREPLGEEDRARLRAQDATRVKSDDVLPGDWVRWDAVVDPADAGPAARVYALDEASGTITFGDGAHGMIPPIGRDAIIAFSYRRTEPPRADAAAPGVAAAGSAGSANDSVGAAADASVGAAVPANTIRSRATLNLVSPVQGVEAAFAADQAAGGAGPEAVERVLRFAPARLRHRERALTLADLEDLALANTPDLAQARAFARAGGVRLVAVMRGADPLPSRATLRELLRKLLAAAPPALAARGALRIDPPVIRRLRVTLTLQVATLDVSGTLAAYTKRTLHRYFDTAAGGADARGWRLGATPTADDVALALVEAPDLESLLGVELAEIGADGAASPWHGDVRAHELVMLAGDDGVRIDFAIMETFA